jgi:DNA polymerase-3 subunit gamma/tau
MALAVAHAPQNTLASYARFEDVIELIRANRDVKLLVEVEGGVRLAAYQPGRIEFTLAQKAPQDLAARLAQRLHGWTGVRWGVTLVNGCEAATIAEMRDADKLALEQEATEQPLVKAVLTNFPKARITEIRTPDDMLQEAAVEALPEVEDEWDPFEDE